MLHETVIGSAEFGRDLEVKGEGSVDSVGWENWRMHDIVKRKKVSFSDKVLVVWITPEKGSSAANMDIEYGHERAGQSDLV
eukprot:CAMPEP_0184752120 /NCGR_PEP_ID=MMETSP0315-20130426/43412_1 /TAXON_ID=101924 /ORGANISM="Rhodosorus marinus, Strain UTEX LB 2760" /LENGTH=80 /DNA_ID=CAMNT_0027231437 /DNA_START=115 /DNA_END=357 /DNA_ORIENTATION=+